MFSDKQSLILCAIVVFGFSISGILGLLDNYAIAAALLIVFLAIVINIFRELVFNHSDQTEEQYQEDATKNEAV